MSFDSKLRRLITGSDTGDLRVWNYSSGNLLRICAPRITRAEGGNREVTGIVTSAGSFSGKYIVSAGWDRRITFYEDATSEGPKEIGPLRYLQGHRADILTLAQGPHNMIATGSDDGEIILWSLDSASLKHRLLPPGHGDRKPTERACECIQFMPSRGSSGYVLASIYADRFLRLWNSSAGNLSLEVYTEHRDGETVPALGINEEGNLIVTGDSKGFLKTWDIKRFNPIKVYNR